MQAHEDKTQGWEVKVDSLPGNYVVGTFAQDYSRYMASRLERDPVGVFFNNVGTWLGTVICLIGFFTIIFGPSTIMVNRVAGPTFFQFV
ncbi:hypothetical protein D3C77_301810 [compost metagenome]